MEFLAGALGGKGVSNIVLYALMIVIAYMFIFRPNIKKRKEAKKFKENLMPGQKVVTIGGIHGKILEISESTVLIQSEGSKLRMEISAIASSVEEQLTAKS